MIAIAKAQAQDNTMSPKRRCSSSRVVRLYGFSERRRWFRRGVQNLQIDALLCSSPQPIRRLFQLPFPPEFQRRCSTLLTLFCYHVAIGQDKLALSCPMSRESECVDS